MIDINMIDEIVAYNKDFVFKKAYKKHIADKYPKKKLAVLTCMDTRLTALLMDALGLKNGDAVIIKNAGALIMTPFDTTMRSLIVAIYELKIEQIMVVGHTNCGACDMSYDNFHKQMNARGISETTFNAIEKDGVSLEEWLDGFKDYSASINNTVQMICNHPLIPKDITVHGFIIDSTTGALTKQVKNGDEKM